MRVRAKCIGGGPLGLGMALLALLLLISVLGPAWGQLPSGKMVSLDFVAADIHDVLKALSVQSGTNVVAGTDVKGTVTISLSNVTLGEALDYITKVSGLAYQMVNGAYVVATPATLKTMFGGGGAQIAEIVPVPNGQATQIQPIAAKMVPDALIQIQGDKGLIVAGSQADIQKVKDLVLKLDNRAAPTETAVTETYRARYMDPAALVVSLGKLCPQVTAAVGPEYSFAWFVKGNSGGSGGGSQEKPKIDSDVVVITGYPSAIAQAKEILAKIDTAPVQILVEAKVVVADRSDITALGVAWDWTSFTMNEANNPVLPPTVGGDARQYGVGLGRFFHNPVGLDAQIHALLTKGDSKLLASPKLSTLSNRPSGIFIGDTFLYPVVSVVNGVSTTTVNSIDVGVSLKIAAVANDDGNMTLCVNTYVSTIRDFLKIGESAYPEVSTREAQTAVRVRDGETILIGGLLREEDVKNVKKFPLLGDLPVIGHLFRDNTTTKTQTEVMVFLTPKLVKEN